ncbi:restriction endonuclease subunit S [Streptomyces ipomoeae]|uniref:restriction endonuclease subunit S n=1 Tax=Streptomyces ipomoeae TaxID=103232 RepID=UPI001FD1630E|nr:restriction endonuclease subunit S [Streptomyces ipomoeae]MDX2938004.1 restriction endonuclease subunit S [Streptomyces ipomoeae]
MSDASEGRAPLPAGWRRLVLKELCSLQVGPHIRSEERMGAGDGVPIVLPRDLSQQRIAQVERVFLDPVRAGSLDRFRLAEGDLLVTRTGTVGRCALVTGEHHGWLYTQMIRLRLDAPQADLSLAAYLTGYLSAGAAQRWIKRRSAGATIPSINLRDMGELPVLLPPPGEQRDIGETLAALDEKVRVHTEIARATGEYRALLADLLMTGELSPGR